MNLSAPKLLVWVIAVIIGLLGIGIHMDFMSVPTLEKMISPFWLVSSSFVLLAVANVFKGL